MKYSKAKPRGLTGVAKPSHATPQSFQKSSQLTQSRRVAVSSSLRAAACTPPRRAPWPPLLSDLNLPVSSASTRAALFFFPALASSIPSRHASSIDRGVYTRCSTMVKLATARECRAYGLGGGGRAARGRWEYINAGAYVFAAVLLAGGFGWHLSAWSATTRSGLAAAALGLLLLLAVNAHDLLAHAAGVDYSLALAAGLDSQFALVEVAVPAVHFAGTVLTLIALIFFEIQVSINYFTSPLLFIFKSVANSMVLYSVVMINVFWFSKGKVVVKTSQKNKSVVKTFKKQNSSDRVY